MHKTTRYGLMTVCSAFAMATALGSAPALAQEAASEEPMEEIVTIGTRVSGRTVTQTPVPVDVINTETLTRMGHTETARMIQQVAPSFNFNSNTITDGSDIARPATLRGLGPDQVLVLVNGKRHIGQAWLNIGQSVGTGATGTDLNSIPPAAIARIEVLRDGASSQYGSDAIAGVINIILKGDTGQSQVTGKIGQTYEGDGETYTVSFNQGISIGDGGYINLTGERRDRDFTDRAVQSNREFSGTQFAGTPFAATPTAGQTIFRIGDSESENWQFMGNALLPIGESAEAYMFGKWSDRDGESTGFYRFPHQHERSNQFIFPDGFLPFQTTFVEDASIVGGVRFEFADDWEFDVSGNWARNQFGFGARNTINASIGGQAAEEIFGLRNPDGSLMRDAGGAVIIPDTVTEADVVAAADQIIANSGPTSGFNGAAELEHLIISGDLTGQFDIGMASPLYVAAGVSVRDETYTLTPGDFASSSCGTGEPEVVQALATIGDPDSFTAANCGFQGFPGYAQAVASQIERDNIALYLDLEANVHDNVLLTGALRWEDYEGVGDKITGKISTRIEVSDGFAIRGAFSTGFRAASLPQEGFTSVVTQAGAGGLTQTLIAPLDDDFTRGIGIDKLDFETSDNFSAGFVWNSLENLTVTVDGFLIDINDRLTLGSSLDVATLQGLGFDDAADSLIERNIGQARTFFNALNTETKGVEFVINHSSRIMNGDLNTTFAGSYIDNEIKGASAPEGLDPSLFTNAELETIVEKGQPNERLTLTLDWVRDRLGIVGRVNYFGSTETRFLTASTLPPFFVDFSQFPPGVPPGIFADPIATPENFDGISDDPVIKIGDAFIVDLEASYRITDAISLAIGANNLLDRKPRKLDPDAGVRFISDGAVAVQGTQDGPRLNASFGNVQFPFRSIPYGINGGFYYLRINMNFDTPIGR